MPLELLDLPGDQGAISERAVREMLKKERGDLRFNGISFTDVLALAGERATQAFSALLSQGPEMQLGVRVDVAVYHPDEGAVYLGLTCRSKTSGQPLETWGCAIWSGDETNTITISRVSFETAAGILEWMNSVDLKALGDPGDDCLERSQWLSP